MRYDNISVSLGHEEFSALEALSLDINLSKSALVRAAINDLLGSSEIDLRDAGVGNGWRFVSVSVAPDILAALDALSGETGLNRSALIRVAVKRLVDRPTVSISRGDGNRKSYRLPERELEAVT